MNVIVLGQKWYDCDSYNIFMSFGYMLFTRGSFNDVVVTNPSSYRCMKIHIN